MVELSVIIPCYNEEKNVERMPEELIEELDKLNLDYEIIAVDDGSKDSTLKILKKLKEKYAFIKIIKHERNKGLASAIKTGIDNAKGEMTVTLDSDYTFHPSQIKNLLDRYKKEDVDIVIGSPALSKGYSDDVPKYRIWLSNGGRLLYNIALGEKITAVTPIFRLYKTDILKKINLNPKPTPQGGFSINAEILAKLLFKGYKAAEIPATLTVREYGESKINNLREIVSQLILVTKIMWWRVTTK